MVLINKAINEVTVKLVYYGPGLCGKTTNLEKIYANPKLDHKGKMISMSTETDRTLFFDFMPMELGTIAGQKVRVQLYTVP
ncbi:MAG TPA: gliding-motility protein MglA, partial [Thermoanaerobaculia bacterium]